MTFRCEQSEELETQLEAAGIELLGYEKRWREYTIRLTPSDYTSSKELLANVIKVAYEYNTRD